MQTCCFWEFSTGFSNTANTIQTEFSANFKEKILSDILQYLLLWLLLYLTQIVTSLYLFNKSDSKPYHALGFFLKETSGDTKTWS